MGRVFFTADTHFGHAGILRMTGRPFATVEEMDAALIANWNAAVAPEDHVYHLGDFTFRSKKREIEALLARLNGTKTLVRGNHDHSDTRKAHGWESVHDLLEIDAGGHRWVLFHYPMMEWDGAFKGAIHLYGHVHGCIPAVHLRCDAGVDAWDMRPASLEQVLARLAVAPRWDPEANYRPGGN